MDRNLYGREVGREIVLTGECFKSFEANSSAHFGVSWSGTANHNGLIFGDARLRRCCHDDCPLPRLHDSLTVRDSSYPGGSPDAMLVVARRRGQRGQQRAKFMMQ